MEQAQCDLPVVCTWKIALLNFQAVYSFLYFQIFFLNAKVSSPRLFTQNIFWFAVQPHGTPNISLLQHCVRLQFLLKDPPQLKRNVSQNAKLKEAIVGTHSISFSFRYFPLSDQIPTNQHSTQLFEVLPVSLKVKK